MSRHLIAIHSADDFDWAVSERERLWRAKAGSADCERCETIIGLIDCYEAQFLLGDVESEPQRHRRPLKRASR